MYIDDSGGQPADHSPTERSTCTQKDGQLVAMLMKTGLNNVFLPTSFTIISNILQNGYIQCTRKNLTTCSKSANKPSTSCVRTACYKLSTSLEQAVNNL